ncbi:MAG: thioredoxin family protein [Bryobacterales bacterium]|nr:thioredoxin family protein [Bryobacterales bacterium]
MWAKNFICGALRVSTVVGCLALPIPLAIAQQESAKSSSPPASGVVVLGEDDFEKVPEAVRGQFLGGTPSVNPSQSSGSGEVHHFDPRRNAAADLRQAISTANRDGKHVLVEVGGNWCPYCKLLDRFFEAQPEVARLRQKSYVFVKVNFSGENQNAEALSKYPQVRGYPHFFVLDGDGALVRSQRVATLGTNTGYSPERFTAFLKASAPKR